MTNKFKVGDRVMLGGVVSRSTERGVFVDVVSRINSYFPNEDVDISICEQSTTFRDQAAIAALQGFCAADINIPDAQLGDVARIAFDFADALDAERRKRNGG